MTIEGWTEDPAYDDPQGHGEGRPKPWEAQPPTTDQHADAIYRALIEDTDAPDGNPRCGICGRALTVHHENCPGEAAFPALHVLRARAQAADHLKTCPFCACSYELPNGWMKDRCPGCNRADNLEDALHQIVGSHRAIVAARSSTDRQVIDLISDVSDALDAYAAARNDT